MSSVAAPSGRLGRMEEHVYEMSAEMASLVEGRPTPSRRRDWTSLLLLRRCATDANNHVVAIPPMWRTGGLAAMGALRSPFVASADPARR